MDNEGRNENRIYQQRRNKVDEIRRQGVNPYPNHFKRGHLAEDVRRELQGLSPGEIEDTGKEFSLAGRVVAIRNFGKAAFFQIEDSSGRIQGFIKKDVIGDEEFGHFKLWDVGDIVGIRGKPFVTRTGELTILTAQAHLLTKSVRPLPEKWHGLKDVETRYRRRYLDLIANSDVRDVFRTRNRLIRNIRSYLDENGFMEVETPMMQPIPGGAVARPFVTHHNTLDMDLYLRVAPELYLKRLVVGGFERVYELNRNFRNEGISTMHNPEFTMLEFYMAYADYRDLMDFTEDFLRNVVLGALGATVATYRGREIDFEKAFTRLSFREAVLRVKGFEESFLDSHEGALAFARDNDVPVNDKDPVGKINMKVFEHFIESTLVDPTFIFDYPVDVSPLSRRSDENPGIAERFELFISGMEIANGFSELNDPRDQEERFQRQVAERETGDEEAHRMDSDYIRALEFGLPPTAGEGIGIDRLVMLITDSPSIRDVILFPHQRSVEP